MSSGFFPKKTDCDPKIYAYLDTHPEYAGLLKVGYTTKDVAERVAEQYPILTPGKPTYKIVVIEPAMRKDGSTFTDHAVHKVLRQRNYRNPEGEWFECSAREVQSAILEVQTGFRDEALRTKQFIMRPEQEDAVEKTMQYLNGFKDENPDKTPSFLWNAKMRFGKTFTAYQLAKEMGWHRVLVLTFKPAVKHSWEEDLMTHIDFKDWQFVTNGGLTLEKADKNKPIVCFGSFQDFLGKNKLGGIKAKNEWVHALNWDCVIFDEYHFGAWRDSAKDLFESEQPAEERAGMGAGLEYFDEDLLPITTDAFLYLSGTPFRAINSGEFLEEQIFNWTYSDEQNAKREWEEDDNPYAALPRMVLMTYQLPEHITAVANEGEFDRFDLNSFFLAEGEGIEARFKFEKEVQHWLNLIQGNYKVETTKNLKLRSQRPPMPFSDIHLLRLLSHTFWFLPRVNACHAMKNLLSQRQNGFFHDFNVIVAAGTKAGIGPKALPPVLDAMHDPLNSRSITLSCGKLTTGVTVPPWTGIFMLRNSSSPETYFQAAFRVQSPWTIRNPDGNSPNSIEIVKQECYVFDFAPNRALRQIADYSCRLSVDDSSQEKKVADFIDFLPILAYDGSSMTEIDAAGVLDMAMSSTTYNMLARKWESALLVNVDNLTLQRLLGSKEAMDALENIEAFRNLNQDIETIINRSKQIKKIKRNGEATGEKKKELSAADKEYRSKRKMVQDKLIKFATRIPVFMYLTDYREHTLKDVITQLEPDLFQRVTGLAIKDFELLVSLGVFNETEMNAAVFGFRRYENASLAYAGINKHEGKAVGGYATVQSSEEFHRTFEESRG